MDGMTEGWPENLNDEQLDRQLRQTIEGLVLRLNTGGKNTSYLAGAIKELNDERARR